MKSLKFFTVSLLLVSAAHAAESATPSKALAEVKSFGNNFARGAFVGAVAPVAYLVGTKAGLSPFNLLAASVAGTQIANELAPRRTSKSSYAGIDITAHATGVAASIVGLAYVANRLGLLQK